MQQKMSALHVLDHVNSDGLPQPTCPVLTLYKKYTEECMWHLPEALARPKHFPREGQRENVQRNL